MKKTLTILLTLALLTACGGKKEEVSKSIDTETINKVLDDINTDEKIEINNKKEAVEVASYDISSVADYNQNELNKECYVEKVKYLGDPNLEELYGDLIYYQEKADEWAKFPRGLEELKDISEKIGDLKGEIQYRSLEVYSKID